MGASAFMMASQGMQGVSSFGGAYAQSQALKTQGDFEKQQYDTNVRLAQMQADDAIARGDKSAQLLQRQTKGQIGSERADMAAQGIDIDSGSAAEIQKDTAEMSKIDETTIRNNAWREAWGYKVQANDTAAKGEMAQIGANNAANNTMLTGGMKFLQSGMQVGYEATKDANPGGQPGMPSQRDLYSAYFGRKP